MAEAGCRYRLGLQHWHPLLRASELGRKPIWRQLCGESIVLFRTAYELQLDVQALAKLADLNPQLSAKTLGPFDKVLLENRRRIQALYLNH